MFSMLTEIEMDKWEEKLMAAAILEKELLYTLPLSTSILNKLKIVEGRLKKFSEECIREICIEVFVRDGFTG